MDWLHRRGISPDVINQFNVTIHNHPTIGDCIRIPFSDEHAKYRRDPNDERKPKYLYDAGGKVTLYGLPHLLDSRTKTVVVTEGECFPQDAQILTKHGWVTFEDYEKIGGDVAQYNEDGTISFVEPIALVKKSVKDETLIEYSDKLKYASVTTKGHNMVALHPSGVIHKFKAEDGPSRVDAKIIRTAIHSGLGLDLSDDELRFQVMVSADFTIRAGGDLYACFKKERKVERFKQLCERLEIPYTCNQVKDSYYSCFIRRADKPDHVAKIFDHYWLSQTTQEQKKTILMELVYWDGNHVPNRNQVEYSSKEYSNATFVQTLAHLCGFTSTIIHRSNKYGEWYKVSILFGKQFSSWQGKKPKEVTYTGNVYCTQVPSGMLLVRQFDCISVSGNCDALVLWSKNIPAVSSTGGAMSFQDDWAEMLNPYKVYLCFDNDDAGAKGMVKVLKLLPHASVILIPELPGIKDISDYVARGFDFRDLMASALHDLTVESVKEDMGKRKGVMLSTRFHQAYLDAMQQDLRKTTYSPSTYTGDDKVLRAKSYPVENLLELKKGFACCPWHNERTPSLKYYPKTNSCYCFGSCGKAYDAIDLYMLKYGVGFKDAVKALNELV